MKCLENYEEFFFYSLKFFSEKLHCFDIMKIIFFVQVLVLPYQKQSRHYSIFFSDLYYIKYDFKE